MHGWGESEECKNCFLHDNYLKNFLYIFFNFYQNRMSRLGDTEDRFRGCTQD